MTVVALTHGYPPFWNMGGEVSLHRTLSALDNRKVVFTKTDEEYSFEGVEVKKIDTPDVLNIKANPMPIAKQLLEVNAKVVIGQNELSLPAVYAAQAAGAISVVNVHTPPRFGRNIREAVAYSNYAIYNTQTAATQWGEPNALVIHPPINKIPTDTSTNGDAYTLLSSLMNKGVQVVLDLAKLYPDKRFIIVRSPAEPTHGIKDLEVQAAKLPNVELHPRVSPEDVHKYLKQTRILLVPSMYETYGMSAIEAAGYGIPSIHVDTPHVREGIGNAAVLIKPLDLEGAAAGIELIESNYNSYSNAARLRAEFIYDRQNIELENFSDFIDNLKRPKDNTARQRLIIIASRKNLQAS
jgi:glycosyltransferase involved in cell wall biosynthesis